MKVLVDALNLIFKFPDLEFCMYEDRLDDARAGLIKILQDATLNWKDHEFVLFVDGKKAKGDYETYQERISGMDIFYSHEKEADDLIREYIKENAFPNRLRLVTSDKKILQYARLFKVKYYTSEQFSAMIISVLNNEITMDPDSKPTEFLESELDHWKKIFTQYRSQTK